MIFSTFYHIVYLKYKLFEGRAFVFKFCASIKKIKCFWDGRACSREKKNTDEGRERKREERLEEKEMEEVVWQSYPSSCTNDSWCLFQFFLVLPFTEAFG